MRSGCICVFSRIFNNRPQSASFLTNREFASCGAAAARRFVSIQPGTVTPRLGISTVRMLCTPKSANGCFHSGADQLSR